MVGCGAGVGTALRVLFDVDDAQLADPVALRSAQRLVALISTLAQVWRRSRLPTRCGARGGGGSGAGGAAPSRRRARTAAVADEVALWSTGALLAAPRPPRPHLFSQRALRRAAGRRAALLALACIYATAATAGGAESLWSDPDWTISM